MQSLQAVDFAEEIIMEDQRYDQMHSTTVYHLMCKRRS